jgi:Histidine kinase-like ATPase domain
MTAHPFRLAGRVASGMGLCWLAPVVEMAAGASGNWPLPPEPGPRSGMCRLKVATCTPGTDAGSVRAARGFTIATLQRWGATDRREDVAIVVSELLTNALRHALPGPGAPRPRCPLRLGLVQPGPCVLCAVADPSQQPPVPKEPSYLAETGRGLQVISALADAWGYTTPSGTGKVVWAMFSTRPALPRLRAPHRSRRIADAGYQAVAPFNCGFAPTEPPDDRHHVHSSTMVADQIALHEALGGDDRAILIAHLWGAVGAWGAAGQEPGQWRRCIILPAVRDLRREHRHLRPDQALVLLLVLPDAARARGRDLGRRLRVHRPDPGGLVPRLRRLR